MDQKKKPMGGQLLLYPEARVPFDTKACDENNSGYYLEAVSWSTYGPSAGTTVLMRSEWHLFICGPLLPSRNAPVDPLCVSPQNV